MTELPEDDVLLTVDMVAEWENELRDLNVVMAKDRLRHVWLTRRINAASVLRETDAPNLVP